jgi:glycosyltransferase involved in cell wall biosynthesis
VSNLPSVSQSLRGWPWQENDSSFQSARSIDKTFPKISVITPSYNQGAYLEQTIRSVLLQHYPNLEYIVIDGASTDNSIEIIKKYEPWLSYWISEADRGQSHAINKGFAGATGQILCWLNSDDYYLPGTLHAVGETLSDHTGNYALAGHSLKLYSDGRPPVTLEGRYENRRRLLQFWKGYQMHQPAIFWRREVFEKVGFLNEDLHQIMDFDYWARISEHYDFVNVDRILACCNFHDAAKTGDEYARYHTDLKKYARHYWGSKFSPEFWYLQVSMINYFILQPKIMMIRRLARKMLDITQNRSYQN